MSREVALVDVGALAKSDSSDSLVRDICSRTSECHLLCNSETDMPALLSLAARCEVRGFSLKLELEGPDARSTGLGQLSLSIMRFIPFLERSSALRAYQRFFSALPTDRPPSVELKICSSGLGQLGELLAALAQLGCPWVFLDMSMIQSHERADCVAALRGAFDLLRIKGQTAMSVHFLDASDPVFWNAESANSFNGPYRIDIDVSNACTHNCVFCGLYGPSFVAEYKRETGSLRKDVVERMKLKISKERCLKLIESLPVTTKFIQFGGEGDPLTHPDILTFISAARKRGLEVELLSNFSYLSSEDIQTLHALAGQQELRFIVNLSAASPEVYSRVRPNQNAQSFANVITALSQACSMAKLSRPSGMRITLMSVINRRNFHEMTAFVTLAHAIGASDVWLKPMEIHSLGHQDFMLEPHDYERFDQELQGALRAARNLGVPLLDLGLLHELAEWLKSPQWRPLPETERASENAMA